MYSSYPLNLLLFPPGLCSSLFFLQLMSAFWTSLACLLACALIFFLCPAPFRICSSSATDLWSGLPSTFPAYLPPQSPGSDVPLFRINISDPRPHSSAVKVCVWVFFPYIPFGTVDAVDPLRKSTVSWCNLQWGGGIYNAATTCTQACTSRLLRHFPLAPFRCPLTGDAADISGRRVNSRSDGGGEGIGGLTQSCLN